MPIKFTFSFHVYIGKQNKTQKCFSTMCYKVNLSIKYHYLNSILIDFFHKMENSSEIQQFGYDPRPKMEAEEPKKACRSDAGSKIVKKGE